MSEGAVKGDPAEAAIASSSGINIKGAQISQDWALYATSPGEFHEDVKVSLLS